MSEVLRTTLWILLWVSIAMAIVFVVLKEIDESVKEATDSGPRLELVFPDGSLEIK